MDTNRIILSVDTVRKTYDTGLTALHGISLAIERGEILALLGPNGAGKTTLISIICGLVNATSGSVTVDGYDVVRDYRRARSLIGLVPQEIVLSPFDRVIDTVRFSRSLFGLRSNPDYIEQILRRLSLWDKKDSITKALSGGMKRRCLIAKALAHEPKILFLDEPTAGVDVELRKDMWQIVGKLKEDGVTTILTTHYIEEAEAIADRVGVISHGELLIVEDKATLMRRFGSKQMCFTLKSPVGELPAALDKHKLQRSNDGMAVLYTYDSAGGREIGDLLGDLAAAGLAVSDIDTHQRSLEEIFVELVAHGNGAQ